MADSNIPRSPGSNQKQNLRIWPEVRGRQIAVLDTVYGREFEAAEREWCGLLSELGLELWHYVAARLVIDAGSWRDKNHPFAYVAAITRRKAKRMRLADAEPEGEQLPKLGDRTTEDTIDYLGQALSRRKSGAWKARRPEDEDYDPSPVSTVERDWLLPKGDPGYDVDWDAVAQAAGLDEIEAEILVSRSVGISRTALMAECRTETEHLEYQAAWRRLSRKMPRVRAVLRTKKNNRTINVPDSAVSGTEAMRRE